MPKMPIEQLDPKAYRAMEGSSPLLTQPKEPVANVTDFTIPLPALVYYHGGGWVVGSIESHDSVCRAIANVAGCAVFSVEYRLAPEHKFPAAVDDAYEATSQQ